MDDEDLNVGPRHWREFLHKIELNKLAKLEADYEECKKLRTEFRKRLNRIQQERRRIRDRGRSRKRYHYQKKREHDVTDI